MGDWLKDHGEDHAAEAWVEDIQRRNRLRLVGEDVGGVGPEVVALTLGDEGGRSGTPARTSESAGTPTPCDHHTRHEVVETCACGMEWDRYWVT